MNGSSLNKQTEALKLALKALEKQVSMAGGWQTPAEATAITAIREALDEKCVCGEPDTPGTHRTDGPCLAEQPQGVKFNEGRWQERETRIAQLEAELMRMQGRELKLQFALAEQPAQQPCEAPCGDIKCAVMCKRHEQPAQQELVQSAPQQAQETGWQALSAGPIKVLHQCRAALIGPVADGLARRCAVAAIDAELARPVQQEQIERTSVRSSGPNM